MSIQVDVNEIANLVAGKWVYLILGSGDVDVPAKAMSLYPKVDGPTLVFDAGSGGMLKRAANGGAATVLVPPSGDGEFGSYSLVVDGTVTVAAGQVVVEPSSGVWHRPAPLP